MITGRYPHNTGGPELHMTRQPHLAALPQFPKLLREAGYYTGQAGKWHFNGDVSESFDYRNEKGNPAGSEKWLPALRERPKDKPFFFWFSAIDAHRPWDMPPEAGPHGPEDVVVPPYMVDTPATREDLARYADEVHRYDAAIGRVVEELKAQGVYEISATTCRSSWGSTTSPPAGLIQPTANSSPTTKPEQSTKPSTTCYANRVRCMNSSMFPQIPTS